MYSRDELVNLLHNGIVRVVFSKVNGEERVMLATLVANNIPTPENPPIPGRKLSEETIRCFDTEKQAWRSFRVDSVLDVKVNV